jgi:hypothetical protein
MAVRSDSSTTSDLNSDAIFRAVASKVGTPNWGALFQGAPFLYL